MKKVRGFTLIEVVVVLAVVAILAAILVPTIEKNINDAKRTRASNEVQVLGAAMASYFKDVGKWPAEGYDVLWTENGEQPTFNPNWNTSNGTYFKDYLITNTGNASNWKGPYLAEIKGDPWGYRYVCNISAANNSSLALFVVSGGDDNTVNTEQNLSTSESIDSSDIGVRLR